MARKSRDRDIQIGDVSLSPRPDGEGLHALTVDEYDRPDAGSVAATARLDRDALARLRDAIDAILGAG